MTANTSNNTLTTDFNVSPWWDDYDQLNNYYRNLFRPGYAVQARELTQSQTMLQNQITRFGSHVFKEGSIVLPGQFSIEAAVDYIKIKDVDTSNNSVDVTDYEGEVIEGVTNGVKAIVIDTLDGSESDANTKTLYVRYTAGGSSNNIIRTIIDGEDISSNVSTITALDASSTGKGSRFVISDGVVFAKGHFVSFPKQSIVLSRYESTPNCRVGFTITESIIRYTQDSSLLDPALESSNYAAPGADRLKLEASLTVLPIDDTTGLPDFVELFTIENGVITELYERSQYNILRDELAKRTFDESGDYYVNGFSVRIREHLDTGINGGYSNVGNNQFLAVGVEPGVAYVKGYEIGKLVTSYVNTTKSLTYENVNSQIISTSYGSYVKANEFTGSVKHDEGTVILLRDVPQQRLTLKTWADGAATGNVIGQARLYTVEYDSGTLGTTTGNVNIYLSDVSMNGTNAFANARALTSTNFSADIVLDSANNAVLKEAGTTLLIYPVGATGIRTIRDSSGNPDMTFTFKRTTDVTIATAGTFDLPITTEIFPYGTTTLTDADKRDIILSFQESANILMSGTVSTNAGNTEIVGSGTDFTKLNVGDKIEFSGNGGYVFVVNTIKSATRLIMDGGAPTLSSDSIFKSYEMGDIIDLTSIGVDNGTERLVTATPTQLSFDLDETYTETISAKVTYQASRTSAQEITKNLRSNRYVIIDCSTAGVSGPFNLGFSDIYQIRNIIQKTGSAPSDLSDGTDVTEYFTLDTGQRDSFYDHGSITPLQTITLGATDFLLIHLDYFEPSFSVGVGYSSIDSYPIDDDAVSNTTIRTENLPFFTSPTTKTKYNLRNYIDFRPIKDATATDATTPGTASTNPADSDAFLFETSGLRLPVPSSQATFDYSYYFARRDIVVIDKDGSISVVKGSPAIFPRTPAAPSNTMALASIYIPPYPSLAPNYAQQIRRTDIGCRIKKLSNIRFTMRDIGVLKNRIINLEYYAKLSLLEKSAIDMQIVDEDGLNRFKNGIFVDTFSDHSLGDITNVDYKIIVDPKEQSIRPIYTMNSLYYDYLSGANIIKTGDLITLPYDNVAFITQNTATSNRNVELSSYRFIGSLFLTPDTDVWVDTETLEDEAVNIGPDGNNLPQAVTTWNEWQTKVVGYEIDGSSDGTETGFSASENQQPVNIIPNPNSPNDQRVTEIRDVTRTGTRTTYSIEENTVNLGTKVVDVSLVPYIRDQVIRVYARGLKANTRMYTFFDNEIMFDYVTPLTETEHDNWPVFPASSEGTSLETNASGECWFALRLPPEKKFRVGTKKVEISDSLTASEKDATTFAIEYFVSHGLVQQKQDTILSTREVIPRETALSEERREEQVIGWIDNPEIPDPPPPTPPTEPDPPPPPPTQPPPRRRWDNDCAAYSFFVGAPEGEEGIFLSQVDLYFASKHPTLGFWIEIREMTKDGGISLNQVPFSVVWVKSEDITTSDDASTPHKIIFDSPIFLYNNTQYAFVIHAEAANPDTYFWIARLGENNISTGQQHTTRTLTGTFFTTNNNLNWEPVADVDLKIKFYRAKFDTSVTGTVTLGNKKFERLLLGNVSSEFLNIGEGIVGYSNLTVSGNTTQINQNYILIGANSGANGTVTIDADPVFTVSNNTFLTGETITIYDDVMVDTGYTTTLSSIKMAKGTLRSWRRKEGVSRIDIDASNGDFWLTDTITGMQSGDTATVDNIEDMRYSVVDFEPSYIRFLNTDIAFEMQPTSNAQVQGSYFDISDNKNYDFLTEQAILSRSNEVSALGGDRSNKIRITMSTDTSYVSPVVDIGRTHSIYVDNIINSNVANETEATGGELENKYISLPITLAEGQDAEDMKLVLTAYRPPTTNIRVWVRILDAEDGQVMSKTKWIELEKRNDVIYSSIADKNDFKDFEYNFSASQMTGPNGEVQYVNNQGITGTGYKFFAIKIGLLNTANNSAIVPRVADLRCIALQL